METAGQRLAVWSWGDGPTAILLHGWGGRSDQLAAFVPPLLAAGFSVVAPDAPGHGDSTGGTSSVLAFAAAIAEPTLEFVAVFSAKSEFSTRNVLVKGGSW